jgi:F-type H+-transporting ATPase subunit c
MGIKSWTVVVLLVLLLSAAAAFASEEAPAEKTKDAPATGITETVAKGYSWMLVAAVLGMAFAAAGAAVAQAVTANAALQGIARQPEASGKLLVPTILTIVFIETLAIYTLVVALLMIFVNPLKPLLG